MYHHCRREDATDDGGDDDDGDDAFPVYRERMGAGFSRGKGK